MSNTEERCDLSSSRDCPERREHLLQRVTARAAEIGGGITVSRLMPSRQRRMIGAWCFLDHAGPAEFEPGGGLAVGPHPHIGLQTFTWMIQGEALHRDSLGNVQVIRPGQVNLMTAGHGIAHTEESLPDERHAHAAQLWIALPYPPPPQPPARGAPGPPPPPGGAFFPKHPRNSALASRGGAPPGQDQRPADSP
ncbi:pirin family protein, partial [Pseudomonas aeruginosa]